MNRNRYTLLEPDVKEYLVKGDRFTKWKEDSKKTTPVTMKMDPKGFYLYWINQSKETEFLDIATIRDTRAGKYAKLPKHPKVRNVFNMDFPDSHHLAKALTIVTGTDTVSLTYHNFFAAKEVAQTWTDDILAIAYNTLRANACRQFFLEKVYVRLSLQTNKDGKIPVKNIFKMFPADKKRVEAALAAASLPKGKFDTIKPDVFTEAAFKTFILNLCPRPEINEIFTSFTKGKGFMTKEMMTKFLNEKQRDSRLNEELFPLVRPEQVKNLIEKYEPSSSNASRGQISPDGLMFYLMGSETSVVKLDKLAQSHDMTQPIPHYFVKSSHNTYLTAGQLTGVSSPEMYRQCLLAGCRCLELDCWKGKPPDEEPIITHGFTMTTEILFKDVIEAIAESAFKTSKYPVVLSFENVDSVKQQEKMAHYCRTIFGDALLVDVLDKYPLKPGHPVPSPSELMGKILIKNKKSSAPASKPEQAKKASGHEQTNTPADDSESNQPADPNQPAPANPEASDPPPATAAPDEREEHDDHDEQDEEKMKNSDEGTAGQEVTAYEEMSALVNYVQPNKFISFENAAKKNKSFVISSFVETKGESLIAKNAVDWVEYNKRQMSRIYPKGTRVDSSNYSPQPFWTAGCQFVALNYQTMDFPMQLNMALFEFNGRTGYLLKHDVVRRSDKKFDPFTDRIDYLQVLLPEMAYLRLVVQEEGGKFLGHRIIPLDALQTEPEPKPEPEAKPEEKTEPETKPEENTEPEPDPEPKSEEKKSAGKKSGDDPGDQMNELKQKLKSELRALLVEQHDQIKKKKEQNNTERLTKLLEMATEKHCSEVKALNSEPKKKNKMKKCKSTEQLDNDNAQSANNSSADGSPQGQSLKKKQAVTLASIRDLISQLNKDAVAEHAKKMWSLPGDLSEAVNSCVQPHFPELVEKAGENRSENTGQYNHVFVG
ncbi:1-phosphatidylinositol 4,5-bisphosphate phosphodiesterase beta-2 [Sinocyclocheilus grahami]|uniref:1-phosphatidylinositol 4,5-bisphosphate phosphodiesterase beta-2 n=1 Tax=Sinocyclocheilus grahami TaxID=75366 RepID=UPI0007ACFCD3|nr:PREDICTED: 1-phosphatidylinositol 4,5-bisphosphate phosphodiesterase beta-2 [Sinocyclocheilus grahami]